MLKGRQYRTLCDTILIRYDTLKKKNLHSKFAALNNTYKEKTIKNKNEENNKTIKRTLKLQAICTFLKFKIFFQSNVVRRWRMQKDPLS